MKRMIRRLAMFALVAALLAWAVPAQALPFDLRPMPSIKPLPSFRPDILDLLQSLLEVDIPDENLRDALCDLLDKDHGDKITRGEMASAPLTGAVILADKGIRDIEGMQYAINMQSLDLTGNPIEKVPKEMGDLDKLEYLGLGECSLSEVPDHVWSLQQLEVLYLAGNELTSIPTDIKDMEELTTLILDDNHLTALPDAIGSLPALETLSASVNKITTLPESMKNCTKLKEIYIMGNELTEIPDWIGSLTHLRTLVADGNQIHNLPGSIASLDEMTGLSIGFNQLSEFPALLSDMDNLEGLFLTANDIKVLPAGLPDWTISILDLTWNDLDLTDHDTSVILDGMESRGIHCEVAPQKPVPVLTADTSQEGIVNLQWPLISDTYASVYTHTIEGFRLQRKTGSGSYAVLADMDSGATGYEDSDIEPGNTYTYKITARFSTKTPYFTYTTYRISTCDVFIPAAESSAAATEPVQATPIAEPQTDTDMDTDTDTDMDEPAAASGGGLNQGLLIGIGVLLILLVGTLAALVVVLGKRKAIQATPAGDGTAQTPTVNAPVQTTPAGEGTILETPKPDDSEE